MTTTTPSTSAILETKVRALHQITDLVLAEAADRGAVSLTNDALLLAGVFTVWAGLARVVPGNPPRLLPLPGGRS